MAIEPASGGQGSGEGGGLRVPSSLRRIGAVAASLLFPGLGQLVNGHWLRGLAFAVAAGVCLWGALASMAGVFSDVAVLLQAASDPQQLDQMAAVAAPDPVAPLLGWNLALLATLALSVWDAWRGSAGRGPRA